MKIVPNMKVTAMSVVMMLCTGMATSCSKAVKKPMYNVTLTQPGKKWFAQGARHSYPVKMEEGCSYENDSVKYVMSQGQLYSINKRTNAQQKKDTIFASDHEAEVFKLIATNNRNPKDTLVLSEENIKNSSPSRDNGPLTLHNSNTWKPSVQSHKMQSGMKVEILTQPSYINSYRYNQTIRSNLR